MLTRGQGDIVTFDVLCGDFNFDNTSPGENCLPYVYYLHVTPSFILRSSESHRCYGINRRPCLYVVCCPLTSSSQELLGQYLPNLVCGIYRLGDKKL